MLNDFVEVLRENLEVAARLHHHPERSHQQIFDDVPLQPERVSRLDDAQIDRLAPYLGKFGKLQDFITSKLFRLGQFGKHQPRYFLDRYSPKNGEIWHSP